MLRNDAVRRLSAAGAMNSSASLSSSIAYNASYGSSSSAAADDQGGGGYLASAGAFDLDVAHIVSIASSCIILIAGCIAVACLLKYEKQISRAYSRPSYQRQRSKSVRSVLSVDECSSARMPLRSESSHVISSAGQSIISPIVVAASSQPQLVIKKTPQLAAARKASLQEQPNRISCSFQSSPIKGKLPSIQIPIVKQLKDSVYDDCSDEITPYAVFRLSDCDEQYLIGGGESDPKTFSFVTASDANYINACECAPTTSRDYKRLSSFAARDLLDSSSDQNAYQFAPHSQSITSGSSNQDELMRAYDYSRRHSTAMHPAMYFYEDEDEDDLYRRTATESSETETPTDPGIREFTKSPPKPNEIRQGACLTPGRFVDDSSTGDNSSSSSGGGGSTDESSTTPINPTPPPNAFGAISRDRSRLPSWARAETIRASDSLLRTSVSFEQLELASEPATDSDSEILKKGLRFLLSSDDEFEETLKSKFAFSKGSNLPHRLSQKPPYRTKSDVIDC